MYAAKGFEIVRWSEIDDETEEEGKLRWPHMLRAAKRAPNPLVVLSTAIKPEYYPALAVQQIEAFKTTRISLRMWPEASRPSLEKRIGELALPPSLYLNPFRPLLGCGRSLGRPHPHETRLGASRGSP